MALDFERIAVEQRRFSWLGALLVICTTVAWCVLIGYSSDTPLLRGEMSKFACDIATVLFLSAGILRAALWRLTGDTRKAQSSGGLLLVGVALAISSGLDSIIPADSATPRAPVARLILVVPLLVLATLRVRGNRRLARLSGSVLVLAALGTVLTTLVFADTGWGANTASPIFLVLEAIAAAVWITLAVQSCAADPHVGGRRSGWVTLALTLMAAAALMRAWSDSDTQATSALAFGCQLLAALIVTATAASELVAAVRSDGDQYGALTRELVNTQQRLSELERRQRQRLHDARSAVLGVAGASALLAGSGPENSLDAGSVRALMTGELDRLEQLLHVDDDEPLVEFELAKASAAVVLARRLDGLVIDTDLAGVRVVGHPRATATVLDNLLRNAHQHARAGRVRVSANVSGNRATITVADDGPGIPVAEREAVLQAGVRGSAARGPGSGFGLYSAARAMAAQSGSLTVTAAEHGGTAIVLDLPAAVAVHAVAS